VRQPWLLEDAPGIVGKHSHRGSLLRRAPVEASPMVRATPGTVHCTLRENILSSSVWCQRGGNVSSSGPEVSVCASCRERSDAILLHGLTGGHEDRLLAGIGRVLPRQLLEQAQAAERAGFQNLWISDHYHPWNDAEGQSPFVRTMIGALAEAVPTMRVTTAMTWPALAVVARPKR
jgi:hypothetical protein